MVCDNLTVLISSGQIHVCFLLGESRRLCNNQVLILLETPDVVPRSETPTGFSLPDITFIPVSGVWKRCVY